MFTGIVEEQGSIVEARKVSNVRVLRVQAPASFVRGVKKGASVAVDGVCLTVVEKNKSALTFEMMRPTITRTTLGKKKVGDCVNLERALRVGQELGGHLVLGHVDGVGRIENVEFRMENECVLRVNVSKKLARYLVPQGSVAVNGVSLTVVGAKANTFSVGLIPYTLAHTNLGKLDIGDYVNIEVDMLAKYVEKLLNTKK